MFDDPNPDPSPDPSPISPGYPTPPDVPPNPPDPSPNPPDPPDPAPPTIVAPVTIPACGNSRVTNFDPITGRPLNGAGAPYGDPTWGWPYSVIVNGPTPTGPTKDPETGEPVTSGPSTTTQGGWIVGGSIYNGTDTSGTYYITANGSDTGSGNPEWGGYNLNIPPGTILTSPMPAQFTETTDDGSTVITTGFLVQNPDGTWSFYITSIAVIDPACPVPKIPLPTFAELQKFEAATAAVNQ